MRAFGTAPERWGDGAGGRLACHYSLSVAPASGIVFWVAAPRPALEKSLHPAPGFVAGLWRTDCAEFFLGNPDNGRYVEFNLGPGGAWWAGGFSAPRVALSEGEWIKERVLTSTAWQDGRWYGRLTVSLPPVAKMLGGGNWQDWTANVTFLVGSGERQRYFSVADLPGGRPDFHQPDFWPPLARLTNPDTHG